MFILFGTVSICYNDRATLPCYNTWRRDERNNFLFNTTMAWTDQSQGNFQLNPRFIHTNLLRAWFRWGRSVKFSVSCIKLISSVLLGCESTNNNNNRLSTWSSSITIDVLGWSPENKLDISRCLIFPFKKLCLRLHIYWMSWWIESVKYFCFGITLANQSYNYRPVSIEIQPPDKWLTAYTLSISIAWHLLNIIRTRYWSCFIKFILSYTKSNMHL